MDDPYSLFFAIVALIPFTNLIASFTLALFRRDLRTIYFCLGYVVNEALNRFLKEHLREFRPHNDEGDRFSGYGMPSSHAQVVSYFCFYLILHSLFLCKFKKGSMMKYLRPLLLMLEVVLVCYSRVRLSYHNPLQVGVGAVIGTVFGISWFLLDLVFLNNYVFPVLEQTMIAKYLYVRDYSNVEDVAWAEYAGYLYMKEKAVKRF